MTEESASCDQYGCNCAKTVLILYSEYATRKTVMTPSTERVSAKIYQFPVKTVRSAMPQTSPTDSARFSDLAYDSCWYHEEAVRDAEKRPQD